MISPSRLLLLAAIVCFILAAIGAARFDWTDIGLALFAASFLI